MSIYNMWIIAFISLSLTALPMKIEAKKITRNERHKTVGLTLSKNNFNDVKLNFNKSNIYDIISTGSNPFVVTDPIRQKLQTNDYKLSFEYFCPKGIDNFEIYFGPDFNESEKIMVRRLSPSEGWVLFSINLKKTNTKWGETGSLLKLNFGNRVGTRIQIRNLELHLQSKLDAELALAKESNKRKESVLDKDLIKYLETNYESEIKSIKVGKQKISIEGIANSKDNVYLCEVPPYQDVTEEQHFASVTPIPNNKFLITLTQYFKTDGYNYDRLLSKWVLAVKTDSGYKLISHAHYADQITPEYNLPDEKPLSKKGLGGFSVDRGHVKDLEDLGITSVTVNVWFTEFMYSKPSSGRIEHIYNGIPYYFDKKAVASLDSTLKTTANKKIIVSAILLVNKAKDCPDPKIGELLQHPDFDPAGIYSMPNMSNPASVNCYAAAIDFLAGRYSRPDKKYGRINDWIIHNEVDAGWVWTNAGEEPVNVFMDTYIKSMRMVYNIARSYNPNSKVFISLTHYWNWTSDKHFYLPKKLLELLEDYSKAEGDFDWAIAQHPYPEDLFNPKCWLDTLCTFSFNTPLITFKNIEVLNDWANQPWTYYLGKYPRTIYLSEQGPNSPDYSEKSLQEQAACMAYAWEKIEKLKNIKAFQYHNWIDGRDEGGLRIGLRRFPDDSTDPGGRKPIWFVYQKLGTSQEDSTCEFAKKIIGIQNWDEVRYSSHIDSTERAALYRNVQSDTWVATDALGRSLLGYNECGPIKKDRFVGIFYFMTHTHHGDKGPYNVTEILKKNPVNPNWGDGTNYYWGEPEIGYYLNTDEWAIKRHAYELTNAGIDVIIFDVTNDETFPEVYLSICKVYREMRAEGEKTPDIAFLGSEISVNKLWNDFYKKALYPDLWFYWKGKPLILFGQHEIPSRHKMNDVRFSEEINKFFTIRQSWAWTSLPWYHSCPYGKDKWPWVDHYPQAIGWHDSPDEKEMVPVAVAEHPLSNIGRSFQDFYQPKTDKYDLTPYTEEGLFFQEQWNRALEVDPKFVFVTGWNEWSADRQIMGKNVSKELQKWKFYPGAQLGKAGKPIKPGESYFIDQYNEEYSRDIEPMKGGYTDDYYYQLIANIRKYKGVEKPVEAGLPKTIALDGNFNQWKSITATYYDHIGDTSHRNSEGVDGAGPYINNTGRNDIEKLKVARDSDNFYFYAEAVESLTPYTGHNWMLLFIDVDTNKTTGWEGYDFVVNNKIINENTTTITKLNKDGSLGTSEKIPFRMSGNKLMIEIPRKFIARSGKATFDFHWADNIKKIGDIKEFFLSEDSAPDRRANYRYSE